MNILFTLLTRSEASILNAAERSAGTALLRAVADETAHHERSFGGLLDLVQLICVPFNADPVTVPDCLFEFSDLPLQDVPKSAQYGSNHSSCF